MKISFLFDMKKLEDKPTDYHYLMDVLKELCCDEYCTYFDEIEDEFMEGLFGKFFNRNNWDYQKYNERKNDLFCELLTECAFNNSIIAFEYILNKYDKWINLEIFHERINSSNMHYFQPKYEFAKYYFALNLYPSLNHHGIIKLLKQFVFNKHIDFVTVLFNEKAFVEIRTNHQNKNRDFADYVWFLKDYLNRACLNSQFKIVDFVLKMHKKIFDYYQMDLNTNCSITECGLGSGSESETGSNHDFKEEQVQKTDSDSNSELSILCDFSFRTYNIAFDCLRKLCSSENKPIYNTNAICPILDLFLETFGIRILSKIFSAFVCLIQDVYKWCETHEIKLPKYFYLQNISFLANCPVSNRTVYRYGSVCTFYNVATHRVNSLPCKLLVNNTIMYLDKSTSIQWLNYFLSHVDWISNKPDVSTLMYGRNRSLVDYVINTKMYKYIENYKDLFDSKNGKLVHGYWYEKYMYSEMINARKKFIEYYNSRFEKGKLVFDKYT